jgi:hypothetical protein
MRKAVSCDVDRRSLARRVSMGELKNIACRVLLPHRHTIGRKVIY